MRVVFSLILLSLFFSSHAQSEGLLRSLVLGAFESQGFQCEYKEDLGLKCFGYLNGYASTSKRVFIYVPKGYDLDKKLNLVLHFHGHLSSSRIQKYGESKTFEKEVIQRFDFLKMVKQSEQNAIIIIPESSNKNKTHLKYFGSEKKFNYFLGNITNLLSKVSLYSKNQELSPVFTAHSGAYKVIAQMSGFSALWFKSVDAVILYDATYGRVSQLTEVVFKLKEASPDASFVCFYLSGTATARSATQLSSEVNKTLAVKNFEMNSVAQRDQLKNDISHHSVIFIQDRSRYYQNASQQNPHSQMINEYFVEVLRAISDEKVYFEFQRPDCFQRQFLQNADTP